MRSACRVGSDRWFDGHVADEAVRSALRAVKETAWGNSERRYGDVMDKRGRKKRKDECGGDLQIASHRVPMPP